MAVRRKHSTGSHGLGGTDVGNNDVFKVPRWVLRDADLRNQ